MSRTSMLILIGVLAILTPFSGLPIQIRTLCAVVLGASVSIIGLLMRAEEARAQRSKGDAQPATPLAAPESEPAVPKEMSSI